MYIYAGSEKIPMAGVGAVDISVSCGQISRTIRLENVAFIPSFHTNIVSLQRFTAKGVHWNTAAGQLFYDGSPFCDVVTQHGQWVLEFNLVPPQTKEQPVHAFPTRSTGPRHNAEATTELWHRRLGHLNNEVVLKLPSAAQGVRLKPGSGSSCQVCPVAKSTAIPSRHPSARAPQLTCLLIASLRPSHVRSTRTLSAFWGSLRLLFLLKRASTEGGVSTDQLRDFSVAAFVFWKMLFAFRS